VHRDAIIDAIWADQPPNSAVTMIQAAVGRLRRLLDPGRSPWATDGLLVSAGTSYRLRADAAILDLVEFESLADQASTQRNAGDLDLACDTLAQALRLWRGGPVCDIEVLRQYPAVTGLAQRHTDTVEQYGEVALASARHEEALPFLRAAAWAEPLRERVHTRLILALAACGQQAAALETYDKLRRRLDDQLGVQPGPELAAAYTQVLRGEVAASSSSPAPGRVIALAPRPAMVPAPRQLPAAPRHFAGRARQLAELSDLLGEIAQPGCTVVISAIDGMAGVGKTALAVHWAHLIAEHFPDGQLYANLRGFGPTDSPTGFGPTDSPTDPGTVLRGFLDALAVPLGRIPGRLDAQAALYRSVLAGRRILVVLDNASDAEQVRPLLPGSPGCLVIVTSRRQLLSLAAAEGAKRLVLDVLSRDEAAELLARRLGADRVAAERHAAAELIDLCGGLPLALRIVAARAAQVPPVPLGELARQLGPPGGRLNGLSTGDPATDVRAVLSWSGTSLTAPAARMLRLLALHQGPDLSARAAASLAGVGLDQAKAALAELSLAHLLTESAPGRFTFHDLLRTYAREWAEQTEPKAEREAAIRRLDCWYVLGAEAARNLLSPSGRGAGLPPLPPGCQPPEFSDYADALAWCDTEYSNLLTLTGATARAGRHDIAATLPATCWDYLKLRKPPADWVIFAGLGVQAARQIGDAARESSMLNRLGTAYHHLGWPADAAASRLEALRIRQEIGDKEGQGATLNNLGDGYLSTAKYAEAIACFTQALDIAREVNDQLGETIAMDNLGETYQRLGEPLRALTCHSQSLVVARQARDRPGEGNALTNLGRTKLMLGNLDPARECFQQALAVRRQSGDRHGEAETLRELGNLHRDAGDPQAARQHWLEALAIYEEFHHPDAEDLRREIAYCSFQPELQNKTVFSHP
jgi:DNA-binding SARP family transcriptional activator